MRIDRHALRWRGACLVLLAAIAALRIGAASLVPWITLVGIPLLIALVAPGPTLLPRSRALTLFLLASLALGMVAAEPWRDATTAALAAALLLVGCVASVLDAGRTVVPRDAPRPAAAVRRRAVASALLVALVVLLSAIGVDTLLAPVPRLFRDEPQPPPRVDRLADQVQPPPAAGAASEAPPAADRALALVQVIEDDVAGVSEPPPARLYLRSRVLDDQVESDGFVFLAARAGESSLIRDGDDQHEDQRIHWPEAPAGDDAASLSVQVTLLSDALDVLLVVPLPRWIEGRALALASDGAIARPSGTEGSFTYLTGGSPRTAFDAPPEGARAATRDRERSRLPPSFDGRVALEQLVTDVGLAGLDDLAKARALTDHLRGTGVLDDAAPFRSWSEFLAARAGSSLHFAQCCALAARLAQLPSRVALGFRTEPLAGSERRVEVRAGDLRFWTEMELAGVGWIAFDPCPEPAPIAARAAAPLDAGPERTDARSMRTAFASRRPLVVGLLLLLALVAFFAFPTLRLEIEKRLGARPPQGMAGPARRAWRYWQELLDCCRRFGLAAHPAHTAEEFARVVGSAVPLEEPGVLRLLRVYHACRFGGAELVAEEERASRELLARLPGALGQWQRRSAG